MQQVLPAGIVCDDCNNYFGTNVEPALLADPLFHVIAVCLRLQHPHKKKVFRTRIFDTQHPAVDGEHQKLHTDITVSNRNINLSIDYSTKGRLSKTYQPKELRLLSRAVHKLAFESLAWMIFVKDIKNVDIFDDRFGFIREWARSGQPQRDVRPVIRLQRFDSGVKGEWSTALWRFGKSLAMEMKLFGDWYAVSLTSSQGSALGDLKKWVGSKRPDLPVWCVTKKLIPLD